VRLPPRTALLLSLALSSGSARTQTADSAHALLTIETGVDTAIVFLDSAVAGRTPLTLAASPGLHLLRLVHSDVTSWLTGSIADTVFLARGEERKIRYRFERRFMVVTVPAGASVSIGDS
jgi:hypothetical protein